MEKKPALTMGRIILMKHGIDFENINSLQESLGWVCTTWLDPSVGLFGICIMLFYTTLVKLHEQGYSYHKLPKAFSEFY